MKYIKTGKYDKQFLLDNMMGPNSIKIVEELTTGLFQAVPRNGSITLESTGNGRNWFYRQCVRARDGKGRFKLLFLNWQDFPEYNLDLTQDEEREVLASLDPDLEEVALYEEGLLSLGQIKFRREKLWDEFDLDVTKFKQEFTHFKKLSH